MGSGFRVEGLGFRVMKIIKTLRTKETQDEGVGRKRRELG
jgi:hypothetical protein